MNKVNNSQIFCTVLNKSYIYSQSLKNKNKLYDYVAAVLTRQIMVNAHVEVRIDKSKGKQFLRDAYFQKYERENELFVDKIKIDQKVSKVWNQ